MEKMTIALPDLEKEEKLRFISPAGFVNRKKFGSQLKTMVALARATYNRKYTNKNDRKISSSEAT